MNSTLAEVFRDTCNLYSTNEALKAVCEKSKQNHKCYKAHQEIKPYLNRFNEEAEIIVSKKRTFEAAENYAKSGQKVAVLNFANSIHPGGGVIHGARAQEECLCRVSTLYDSLISPKMQNEFYLPHLTQSDELATDDVIYTPDVMVFKSDTAVPELLPQDQWFSADVLTCAAPCLTYPLLKTSKEDLLKIHQSRARQILNVACINNADVIILGAFGCGAFANPPEVVAAAYKEVLNEYKHAFKTVEFAVYCSSYETQNFETFNSMFNKN